MIFFLLSSLSLGRDNLPEMWVQLHEGRLVHLVEGEAKEAIEIFEALLSGLSDAHPLYGELMFSLGCAQYDANLVEKSLASLLSSRDSVHAASEAEDFFLEISAQEKAIKTVPYAGMPWVSIKGKSGRSSLYKANLEANTEQVHTMAIDIRLDEASDVTVSLEGWNGKSWKKTNHYNSGNHILSLDTQQLLVDNTAIEVRSIEVGVEKQNVLTVLNLIVK